jgi:hypothetical protein
MVRDTTKCNPNHTLTENRSIWLYASATKNRDLRNVKNSGLRYFYLNAVNRVSNLDPLYSIQSVKEHAFRKCWLCAHAAKSLICFYNLNSFSIKISYNIISVSLVEQLQYFMQEMTFILEIINSPSF